MYHLLSSTRLDSSLLSFQWNNDQDGPSPFFLLPYHYDRLVDAAKQHNWDKVNLSYQSLKLACTEAANSHHTLDENPTSFRIRITLSQNGDISVSATPLPSFSSDPAAACSFNPLSGASYEGALVSLAVDSEATPSTIFTTTKTTQRTLYDQARARAGIPAISPTSDVLLFNEDGLITESSICNVAFYRSSKWITPATSTGCLPGVLRRYLLSKSYIHEDTEHTLRRDAIKDGEWVLLFNGVQGCRLAKVTL
ncbi:hypothetical protein D9758_002171 [Tetrapyrgos nigripes]|uniref:Aminodeoxychorismate lyase n=1 Tax=Tetrapyrgos nigripes TaxID=182062 RepID=A0A8H5GPI4_9AGAR|nr:hypothetical protein D9758_002171 [Tetrapyrgos nigripes]